MVIGIVTVLFNCPEVLDDFFRCLGNQSFEDYKIYVIDNSTNEESYEETLRCISFYNLSEKVILIRNDSNVGVAAANNQGIRLSLDEGSKYTLLINNDIVFEDSELLEKMYSEVELNEHLLIVPKILYFDSKKIWNAGGRFNSWLATTQDYGIGQDRNKFNRSRLVDYAPTCCMLIRNTVFNEVGFMDEKYFVYYDDSDFIWRVNALGLKVYYWAEGVVEHKVSSSTGGEATPFSRYYMTRNRVYFSLKNLGLLKRTVALMFLFSTRIFRPWFWSRNGALNFFRGVRDGFKLR